MSSIANEMKVVPKTEPAGLVGVTCPNPDCGGEDTLCIRIHTGCIECTDCGIEWDAAAWMDEVNAARDTLATLEHIGRMQAAVAAEVARS